MTFSKWRIFVLMTVLLPLQERKPTLEEYVSSFSTEKMEAMFEAFLHLDDQKLSFMEKQEKLCCLAKDMDPGNPLAFIKDLELQIPSLGDTANEEFHGSLEDEVQEDLGFSPDHLLQVSDAMYRTQSQDGKTAQDNSLSSKDLISTERQVIFS